MPHPSAAFTCEGFLGLPTARSTIPHNWRSEKRVMQTVKNDRHADPPVRATKQMKAQTVY
ncbi:MAG: hypothetical protein CL681_11850 [Blastopirellula sp.]|nr:hypothetical protein [Blastopirellula sp.]